MMTRLLRGKIEGGPRPEGGFTLLEMVISVILLVLITGAIGAALVSSLNATSATKTRVNETNDAQIIAGFLTRDAQAAGGTNPATGYANPALGVTIPANNGCAAPGTSISIIGFKWIDLSTGTTYESNYSFVATATGIYQPQQFLRTVCSTTSPTGTQILANNVVTTVTGTLQPPSAGCTPSACSSVTSIPQTVSMTISDYQSSASNVTTPDTFTLTASLRPQSNAGPDTAGSGGAQTAPMLLTGGGPGCSTPGITGSNNPDIQISGVAAIDSCPAATLGGSAQASAGTFVVAPATCLNITGTCTVVSSSFADPYAALITAGKLTPPSTAGCNGGANPSPVSGHYQPGTYPQALSVNNGTFDAGPAGAPGVYVFCNGLSVGTLTGSNVMLYFKAGSLTAGNGSNLTLSPPTSGQYVGLAVWQAAGNTDQATSGNSNTIVVNINGTFYAPSARTSFKNGQIHIQQLIAVGVDLNGGNGNTFVGTFAPVAVTPGALPNGTQNQLYPGATLTASGGGVGGGYTWQISGLPAGMNYGASTGIIGGTPTVNTGGGTVTVTATATDVFGNSSPPQTFSLRVISAPIVTSTNPNSRGQGAANQNIVVTGQNFVNGGSLGASFSGSGITVNATTFTNTTHVTVNISIASGAATGARNLTVTSGDGGVGTGNNVFTVNSGPTGLSANPNTSGHGLTSNVTIGGSGFVNGAVATFANGITVNSTTFNSASQVTANITVTAAAALGAGTVNVTNPDGGTATGPNLFTVVAPQVTSVTLVNKAGQTAGTIEAGDTISVVFSSQMDESDFCAAWTTDTADPSLSVTGNLVTLNDGTGPTNDSITLTAPVASCASGFHFDSIDLGSNAYVNGGLVTFGTSGGKSTFAWNHTTRTLTITLGTKAGAGTVANVVSSAPTYTASPLLSDVGNSTITNSPFPLTNAKQF